MKAVVLDGYAANPGDIDMSEIENLCELVFYDRTSAEMIAERAADAEIILTNKTPLSAETLRALPKLRFVSVLATGYNIVDIAAARELGIGVSNVPEYSTEDVAQMTFALLLEVCLRVGRHSESVHRGDWSFSSDFSYALSPLIALHGKTMGIVGDGRIGRRVAEIAGAFGMRVLTCGLHQKEGRTSLEEVICESDVISLHCPLTDKTKNLINRDSISKMKDGAIIINTSRGPVINESDLREALECGKLYGAGVDVLSEEPPVNGNPLLESDKCVITPHIAWASFDARVRLFKETAKNIEAYLKGQPINLVN
ncbi:MAG: D-2-hydroxyacid dehydrogenase [Firmicutes bacterium]|nr:D-2-hydroxyacid dehydrogenase [Bacillota bacterium]